MSPNRHTPTNKKCTRERVFPKRSRTEHSSKYGYNERFFFSVVDRYIFATEQLIRTTERQRLPSEQASCTPSTCTHRRCPDVYKDPELSGELTTAENRASPASQTQVSKAARITTLWEDGRGDKKDSWVAWWFLGGSWTRGLLKSGNRTLGGSG